LIQDKIDIIHVSRGFWRKTSCCLICSPPAYLPRAINLDAAAAFKKALHIPVSVVGALICSMRNRRSPLIRSIWSRWSGRFWPIRTVWKRETRPFRKDPPVRKMQQLHSQYAFAVRPDPLCGQSAYRKRSAILNREPRHDVRRSLSSAAGPAGLRLRVPPRIEGIG
jgi:hypothetical protein